MKLDSKRIARFAASLVAVGLLSWGLLAATAADKKTKTATVPYDTAVTVSIDREGNVISVQDLSFEQAARVPKGKQCGKVPDPPEARKNSKWCKGALEIGVTGAPAASMGQLKIVPVARAGDTIEICIYIGGSKIRCFQIPI